MFCCGTKPQGKIFAFVNCLVTLINGSGPRHSLFVSIQNRNEKFKNALIHLSNTRWGSRDRSFKSIKNNIEPILYFIRNLKNLTPN